MASACGGRDVNNIARRSRNLEVSRSELAVGQDVWPLATFSRPLLPSDSHVCCASCSHGRDGWAYRWILQSAASRGLAASLGAAPQVSGLALQPVRQQVLCTGYGSLCRLSAIDASPPDPRPGRRVAEAEGRGAQQLPLHQLLAATAMHAEKVRGCTRADALVHSGREQRCSLRSGRAHISVRIRPLPACLQTCRLRYGSCTHQQQVYPLRGPRRLHPLLAMATMTT